MESAGPPHPCLEEKTPHISLCRPGFEAPLREELLSRAPPAVLFPSPQGGRPMQGEGWVAWEEAADDATEAGGNRPLVFERQRLPAATFWEERDCVALAERITRRVLPQLAVRPPPYALHVFTPNPTGGKPQGTSAARLEAEVRGRWAQAQPASHAALLPAERFRGEGGRGSVWQLCLLAKGVWSALSPAELLPELYPGGVHRMRMDRRAPSRAYLKIEEALEVLGRQPRPRERAIDLGAAPGGWSYAFLKRGCRVLAVDRGPLKLTGLDALAGTLSHLREDGLRFRPPPGWLPVDWLLSDMLIPPGVCLGLLRKWLSGRWARRFIVNIKLPQREPLVALRPVQALFEGVPGLHWRIRQLYHDRREVTAMGELPAEVLRPTKRGPVARPRPAERKKKKQGLAAARARGRS